MIFNSVTFLVFLIIAVALYWVLPTRPRLWMIFLSGLVFYGFWRVEFIPVMLFSAFTDYFVALKIDAIDPADKRRRRHWLILSFVVNFGLLAYFKYLMFFTRSANDFGHLLGVDFHFPLYNIVLPLGISFYTFESVSYTVDVYRGHLKANRDIVLYGCFITFFPKLIAGPILRASEILHQVKERPAFQLDFITEGLDRILKGLFLKVVFADNIAPFVDEGYKIPAAQMSAIDVWTLAFLFGFQIYFDFAAYSHIAIGCGKLMGVNISENFNYPYLATSFKDFWKRWHISLSTWIRDYLYLPLSGKQVIDRIGARGNIISVDDQENKKRRDLALFLTWAIMGLWHGANWTFVIWGIYHATLIFIERLTDPLRIRFIPAPWQAIGWFYTLPLAMLSWVPFRARTVSDTFIMFGKVLTPGAYLFRSMRENTYLITFLMLVLMLLTYFVSEHLDKKIKDVPAIDFVYGVAKYTVMIILVFTFLRPISQFIYFQF